MNSGKPELRDLIAGLLLAIVGIPTIAVLHDGYLLLAEIVVACAANPIIDILKK